MDRRTAAAASDGDRPTSPTSDGCGPTTGPRPASAWSSSTLDTDRARVRMTVGDAMVNGHDDRPRRLRLHAGRLGLRARLQLPRPAHGGRGRRHRPSWPPARLGDVLVAEATQRTAYGRSGLTDVTVTRESDGGSHRGVPRPVPVAGQQGEVDERSRTSRRAPTCTTRPSAGRSTSCAHGSSSGCSGRVRHAYDHVAALPQGVRGPGRPPRRHPLAGGHAAAAVHQQGRPAGQLPVRHVRGAARAGVAGARLQRHDGQAHRRRLHPRGPADVVVADGAVDPRRRRPARATSSTWPTATGCSPAGSARTTAPRRSAAPSCRSPAGMTERQVQLITDFAAARDHGDAVVLPVGPGRDGAGGHRPARDLAGGRHLRRRAVDRGDARRDRGAGRACTRSTSTGCPR